MTRTYDQNYWLNRIQVTATGVTALDLTFAQDNAGKLSTVTDNAATGRGASFAYTASDRVSQAIGPRGEEDYAYDAAGNRTSLETIVGGTTTTETETPDTATNRLISTSIGGTTARTLTYRTGGDLYTDAHAGGTTYQYDYNARKRVVGGPGRDPRPERISASPQRGPEIGFSFAGVFSEERSIDAGKRAPKD
jgi:YD repeat-containing protein